MTQMLRPLIATFVMALMLAHPATAATKTIPAPSRAELAATSSKANETVAPGDQAKPQDVVVDKAAAISEAEAIGAFDPALVKGEAHAWQTYFQKAGSPVMEKIEGLHDLVMVIITVVTIFVTVMLGYIMFRFSAKRNPKPRRFAHNTLIEIIWTVIPILILIVIGIPSIRVHYQYTNNQNIIDNPDLTLKVTGNQWYWHYDYPDAGFGYDSNIVKDADLKPGQPRLLMVDNPIVVPVGKVVRVQITSADVIHSWAMPAFGVKQDAVPGKLSETWFKANETGIYFGQCSELCGKFHGFMPIMIKVVSEEDYKKWLEGAKLKYAASDSMQFAALN